MQDVHSHLYAIISNAASKTARAEGLASNSSVTLIASSGLVLTKTPPGNN